MGPAGLTLLHVVRMLAADSRSRGALETLQKGLAGGQGLRGGLHSSVLLPASQSCSTKPT